MMPGRKTLAIVLIAALLLMVTPATAASSEPGVHITRMTIDPDGRDFNVTVHYSTSLMTKIFSLLFGAKVVQPGIVDQLSGFGDVKLVSIDTSGQMAKLQAKNQTNQSGDYYFYNGGAKFPAAIDLIEIRGNAVDRPVTARNAKSVPAFYYHPEYNGTNNTMNIMSTFGAL
jgi:hypothetical protein